MDHMIFEKNIGIFEKYLNFYFLYSLAPLTMLEHLFGQIPTLTKLKGPSWTFIHPKMDPQMDPWRLI